MLAPPTSTMTDIDRLLADLDQRMRRLSAPMTADLRAVRRATSRELRRPLAICRMALADRDPTVAKALSWALRELGKRSPADVEEFLDAHGDRVASLVRGEVRSKLRTGLKTPRRASAR